MLCCPKYEKLIQISRKDAIFSSIKNKERMPATEKHEVQNQPEIGKWLREHTIFVQLSILNFSTDTANVLEQYIFPK